MKDVPVTKVDEDAAAVVPAVLYPAEENDLLTDRARELAERLCTGDPLERAVESILTSNAAVDRS